MYSRSHNRSICTSNSIYIFFGGIASVVKGNFDLKIFLSGFFGNSILAIALTYLGEKLNVDIYLAAIVVFVGRMFMNLGTIRRYYIEKWINIIEKKNKNRKQQKTNEA